jgi:hypothetical protein
MDYSDNKTFKEDLEAFLEHWSINHAVILIPQSDGNISLMGAGMDQLQIQKLLVAVNEHMPSVVRKRLN